MTEVFVLECHAAHRDLLSFPTRRSSDLTWTSWKVPSRIGDVDMDRQRRGRLRFWPPLRTLPPSLLCSTLLPLSLRDRKSTRLNSSHSQISYAVFCLKKKNKISTSTTTHD